MDLLALLPKEQAERTRSILASDEAKAGSLMSNQFVAMSPETTVRDALAQLRQSMPDKDAISYLYIVREPDRGLVGVVDLRELVLAPETSTLRDLMATPPVAADEHALKEQLVDLFAKYQFRMLPVIDANDRLVGVIDYNDIMR